MYVAQFRTEPTACAQLIVRPVTCTRVEAKSNAGMYGTFTYSYQCRVRPAQMRVRVRANAT